MNYIAKKKDNEFDSQAGIQEPRSHSKQNIYFTVSGRGIFEVFARSELCGPIDKRLWLEEGVVVVGDNVGSLAWTQVWIEWGLKQGNLSI